MLEKQYRDDDEVQEGIQLITVKIGQKIVVESDSLELGFLEVMQESRCPRGVMCFWSGEARIKLWVVQPGIDSEFVALPIYGYVDRHDSASHIRVLAMGYQLTLLQLDPYPVADSLIQESDYTALLRIE